MWAVIASRITQRYLGYLTLPVAIVVGTIGYKLEQHFVTPKQVPYLEHSIVEERLKREMMESDANLREFHMTDEKSRIAITMGKKAAQKAWTWGAQRKGPNRQVGPAKPEPPPESESDDSFTLDEPVENINLPASSDSEDDTHVKKETVMVKVKQTYKNPTIGRSLYGPIDDNSDVVSANAKPDEIEYKIEIVPFEKKKKAKSELWIESMYSANNRNRNPPMNRPNNQKFTKPIQPHMIRAPVHPRLDKQNPGPSSEVPVTAKQGIKDEWDMESLAESLAPSGVAPSSNWDTESIASSAWDNTRIVFK
ncbi:hypothetical protein M3Y97_00147300 [Aphelenchoides bicaudatus]|nr:hypothetical protein M3Y97_00147300 [Aphelenchoides bicaudatus]